LTDLWGRVSQSGWELQCNAVFVSKEYGCFSCCITNAIGWNTDT